MSPRCWRELQAVLFQTLSKQARTQQRSSSRYGLIRNEVETDEEEEEEEDKEEREDQDMQGGGREKGGKE